jgi:hypothetical protein
MVSNLEWNRQRTPLGLTRALALEMRNTFGGEELETAYG